jgi:D-alanyl-D-alanine carboxypeptidase
MMNDYAVKLKMYSTAFNNPNGLHDKNNFSTARDLARMTISLYSRFDSFRPLFLVHDFTYNGRKFVNHNRVTNQYEGATGLKTGYVAASGYNIISTANRDGHDVMTVVIGGSSDRERYIYATTLLDYGFEYLSGGSLHGIS